MPDSQIDKVTHWPADTAGGSPDEVLTVEFTFGGFSFVALNGLKALSEDLPDVRSLSIQDPAKAFGVLAPYVSGRINRAIRPGRMPGAHASLSKETAAVSEQAVALRDAAEAALRKYGKQVQEKQLLQKRMSAVASGIYSQVAVIGRASASFADDPARATGPEKVIARNYLKRSRREVARNLKLLEKNDDAYSGTIGAAVREAGGYSYDF